MSDRPENLLDAALIRRLAGEPLFARGEACFTEGRVRKLRVAGDRVAAHVEDTISYRVKLWKARGELRFSCGCPAGLDHGFCQHCVAVGLAWLVSAGKDEPSGAADDAETREKLSAHLRTLGRERLVRLVMEASDYDDILRRRLLLEAAGVARDPSARAAVTPDLDAYLRLLREAINTEGYVDYDAMPDYALGVQEAIAPLDGLLRGGFASAVIELAEQALLELDKVSDLLDGSDGSLNSVYDDLQRLHLAACHATRPDPEELAERLLRYEVEGGLGVFNNAAKAYAEVLGKRGTRTWRRLLIEQWSQLPAASGHRVSIDHRRFQLRTLMERLAESENDFDALVAIKERDLTSAHDYLSLAELHAAHGQHARGLACAEEGLRVFPSADDSVGLRDFLIAAYERAGRWPEVRKLMWQEFIRTSDAADYQRFRDHLHRTTPEDWPAWRERALDILRNRSTRDASTLVEILLEEGEDDRAWREARAGGCRVDLWLRLAAGREKKHPADALGIYQTRLEPTIAAGGPTAYREAIELLDKIRALLGRLGREEDFAPFRAEVRAAHRQRRSFLRLLDAER